MYPHYNTHTQLYAGLDGEKQRGMASLLTALTTYKEQHSAILEAIVVFAGRIHQHASDYLQREQLVSRAFQQYLLSIVSGALVFPCVLLTLRLVLLGVVGVLRVYSDVAV